MKKLTIFNYMRIPNKNNKKISSFNIDIKNEKFNVFSIE